MKIFIGRLFWGFFPNKAFVDSVGYQFTEIFYLLFVGGRHNIFKKYNVLNYN